MIRQYCAADAAETYEIFRDGARYGSQPHYSAEQGMAWAPSDGMTPWWKDRMSAGLTWVWQGDDCVRGFVSLVDDGYLDMFFVRPEDRGLGIASSLYDHMIDAATQAQMPRLTTHASHLARRFLERRGWQVTCDEVVERNGVSLARSVMMLNLEN